jgi:type II secretory pathway component PulJ
MTQRKGSTLVELVLSMSAGSTVMLLAICLVHQTMTMTQISKHRSDHDRTLDQFAQCFRRDVHLSMEVVPSDSNSLALRFSDGSEATYTVDDHAVSRKRKDGPDGDEFERFVLGNKSTARLEWIPSTKLALLVVLSETGIKERPSKPDLVVEAMVGRWKSLEEGSGVSQ